MREQSLAGKVTDLGDLKPQERFCRDCRHMAEVDLVRYTGRATAIVDKYQCAVTGLRSPVDGQLEIVPCHEMRSAEGVDGWPSCGPEGKLWEPEIEKIPRSPFFGAL